MHLIQSTMSGKYIMLFAILYGIVRSQEMLARKIHDPFGPVCKSPVDP